MSTNNHSSSTQTRRRKRLIIMGCCLGGVGLIGGGVGIGFAVASAIHKDKPLTLTTDKSEVKTDAESTTTIKGTIKSFNFTIHALALTGDNAGQFDGFVWASGNNFTVKVKDGTAAGIYKLQVQANGDNDIQSNEIPITVNDPAVPPEKGLSLSVDRNQVVSDSMAITGTITAFNLDYSDITSLALTGDDAAMFETISWTPGTNTFTTHSNGKNGNYNLQLIANNSVTTNACSVKIKLSPVADGYYYAIDENGLESTVIVSSPNLNLTSQTPSLATLIFGYCSNLESLTCDDNSLTNLDVSACTTLESLTCDDNSLTTLDVSACTTLESLTCDDNSLTTLDVSNNPALAHLFCSNNLLSTLDVSNNPALTQLHCNANSLSTLDVTNNPLLENFNCSVNSNLSSISLATITSTTFLDLRGDVSGWKASGDIYKNGGNWNLGNTPAGWTIHP